MALSGKCLTFDLSLGLGLRVVSSSPTFFFFKKKKDGTFIMEKNTAFMILI